MGEEDPGFAGGSYVVVQKYLHDLDAWEALPVEAQERVVGRRKLSDVELADDVKPPDSHVALTTVTDADGAEREILRDNMPFGAVGTEEFGTYFIGYARTPEVTETMLARMFLGTDAATHDRIPGLLHRGHGLLFFTPAADFLEDSTRPARLAGQPEPEPEPELVNGRRNSVTPVRAPPVFKARHRASRPVATSGNQWHKEFT
ncbi:Dyp-type peroxidase [Streptomyces sp. KL116D]|uniref:Dyp-type peroxidase n=1 Tax=Streptomyces sp. KL116D TaxID=3045152 RepID=UPI003557726C